MRISDWSSDVCSSDLRGSMLIEIGSCPATGRRENGLNQCTKWGGQIVAVQTIVPRRTADPAPSHRLNRPRQPRPDRSEEHTSELQSLMRISYAVFRLNRKNYFLCQHNDYKHYYH